MLDKLYSPSGCCSLGALQLRKQHPAGSAGTTMVGSVELLYRLSTPSWWPDDGAHGISILLQHSPPPMKCRGRRGLFR